MVILKEYFNVIVDLAFWVQMILVAILTVTTLTSVKRSVGGILKASMQVVLLVGIFFSVNYFLYWMATKNIYFAGIGTWVAYLAGIILFSVFACTYDTESKIVTASAVGSMSIIVIALGSAAGNVLEVVIDGFDTMWSKVASDVLILVAAWVIRKRPVNKYHVSAYAAGWNIVCCALSIIVVIGYDVITIHFFRGNLNDTLYMKLMITLVCVALYVINGINYLMTYALCREQKHVLQLTSEAQLKEGALHLLSISDHSLNELRNIRHNINNQYSYMNVLLQNKDYDGLQNYFDEVLGTFSKSFISYVDCGNRELNAIFNLEKAKADAKHIALDLKILVPSKLNISELDLCNVLTNIIDNAIENCQMKAGETPAVTVAMSMKGDYLFGRITNPTDQEKEFLQKPIVTSKKEKMLHGKGIHIVKQIIKRYNGYYKHKIEKGRFIVEFLLDNCAERAGKHGESENSSMR